MESSPVVVWPALPGPPLTPTANAAASIRHVGPGFLTKILGQAGGGVIPLTVIAMLLWINGPFGGGKSSTARELRDRLPGSLICDPEHLGFGLQRMLPTGFRRDFQDFRACTRCST